MSTDTPKPLQRMERPPTPIRYPADVARIKAALNGLGYDASERDIVGAYEEHCDEAYCAGWASMDLWNNDEAAARAVLRYLQPVAETKQSADDKLQKRVEEIGAEMEQTGRSFSQVLDRWSKQ